MRKLFTVAAVLLMASAAVAQTFTAMTSTEGGKLAVVAGNFNPEERTVTLRLGKKYPNMALASHSLNNFAGR